MEQRLTFVTVVFDAELPLLDLQARSMALYLVPEAVESIIVLDNCVRSLSGRAVERLRSLYGALGSRMRVVRVPSLVEGASAIDGWRSQQAAKLLIAGQVPTARYVVLDAKNHFIRPTDASSFVGADGRPHLGVHAYETHSLRSSLERTLTYLGAGPEDVAGAVASFPQTATPFVFDTGVVCDMVKDIGHRSGLSFAVEFERQGLLEFFLYSGWAALRGPGLNAVTDGRPVHSPLVWPGETSRNGVEAAIRQAREQGAVVFGVHRRVLARADRATRDRIAEFWAERGLLDQAAARRLIRRFRRAYVPTMAVTRLHESMSRIVDRRGSRR